MKTPWIDHSVRLVTAGLFGLLLAASLLAPVAFAQSTRATAPAPAPARPHAPIHPQMPAQADPEYPHAQFTTTSGCTGWAGHIDIYGYPENFSHSTGSRNCTQARWDFPQWSFNAYLWVPSSYANAFICLGFYQSGVRVGVGCVDESAWTDQWAPITLKVQGNTTSEIDSIRMSSNNGETGTYIGLGCAGGRGGLALVLFGSLAPLPKSSPFTC